MQCSLDARTRCRGSGAVCRQGRHRAPNTPELESRHGCQTGIKRCVGPEIESDEPPIAAAHRRLPPTENGVRLASLNFRPHSSRLRRRASGAGDRIRTIADVDPAFKTGKNAVVCHPRTGANLPPLGS